jgi:hypothetical protein
MKGTIMALKPIDIGNIFSSKWKVESNLEKAFLEHGSNNNCVYIDLMGGVGTLKINNDSVEISGGGFRKETTRGTKTFTDGKGHTVKVTRK